ncbi:MAG: glycosyltransferase [Chthonomonadales bacterium]
MTDHKRARRQFAQKIDLKKLSKMEADDRAAIAARLAARSRNRIKVAGFTSPVVAGFYVNWEETSKASLRRHIDELTHFFPEWLHLTADGRSVFDGRIEEDKVDVDPFVRQHGIPIVPVINNFRSLSDRDSGNWDSAAVHRLLSVTNNRSTFINHLKTFVLANRWQGVNIDFEEIPSEDREHLSDFMSELYTSFHADKLIVTQDIQVEDDAFDIQELANSVDALIPMLYDQHSPGTEEGAGSLAGIDWTRKQLTAIFKKVPSGKIILGLGNYAYDWQKGSTAAVTMSYQQSVIQAKESQDPADLSEIIQMDAATLNPFYKYLDDEGQRHSVWMMDATTSWNQWQVAKPSKPAGVALWYLGAEDPGFWSILGKSKIGTDQSAEIDQGVLNNITYGRAAQVDFEGEGELLNVVAQPQDGKRSLVRDVKTGMISKISYLAFPSGYVVRRFGSMKNALCLTFDDGPDATWTPAILDLLKSEGVKATFFVVGQQAQNNPSLIARIWDEGHEIGNHSFSHPNFALTSRERTLLEITTTQRIIEAITGHTTSLFRPPYAIDVEPRTGGELKPIILASQWNFISVGEKIDPQDWRLIKPGPDGETIARTAEDIAEDVWNGRYDGNIVLLHDGGGNRATTLEALRLIIRRFKKAGIRFIQVSDLIPSRAGVDSRSALFPRITGRDEALVGVDKYVFETTYLLQRTIVTLFTLSLILGISRQLIVSVLALIQRAKEDRANRKLPFHSASYRPLVSVLIAAYNEEKVINRTIETVLASDYPDLQVVVVDDGSKDSTFEVVMAEYGEDPRVVALKQGNGGKSSALNHAMTRGTGEILVALDADTLFAKDTIRRLVRHFEDPLVGAVSGNVKVGNATNILTRWQALEYITSQNFDRRAYDLLNCITVVPGAVGAWRREAVSRVGGYSDETLAEDTDLTWKIRRAGWRIANDGGALAFTEAPESLPNLAKQRFRWAFGTLQNLFKHRDATFRHGAFGWVALPSLWLYQILFPAISPIMDVTVVWALITGHGSQVVGYYLLMIFIEFLGAAIAIRLDRASWGLLPWLFLQRFVYRQMMYYVILKSLVYAVRGGAVGWNKFERTGTAQAGS